MGRSRLTPETNNSALGFEATLWAMADKLHGNLDAECKQVGLGLISESKNETAAMRDALLPKLLSGELRVPTTRKDMNYA